MQTKNFQRAREDFKCKNCGFEVRGNGYTNHCPRCLWSLHVDVSPGDRAEKCGGMMEPMSAEEKSGEYVLTHKCKKCGIRRRIKTMPQDNIERIIELSSRPA